MLQGADKAAMGGPQQNGDPSPESLACNHLPRRLRRVSTTEGSARVLVSPSESSSLLRQTKVGPVRKATAFTGYPPMSQLDN